MTPQSRRLAPIWTAAFPMLLWTAIAAHAAMLPAVLVLGQHEPTTSTGGATADRMDRPNGVWTDGTHVVVADTGNNRVLVWNALPQGDGAAADVVVGQTAFGAKGSGGGRSGLNHPRAISDGTRLFVADADNHRVLIWNTIPTTNGAPADVVVGQPDFDTREPGTAADRLYSPRGIFSDGQRLFVSDSFNHRVLVWNQIPTANGAPADLVLGQKDFAGYEPHTGASGLRDPRGVFFDGTRLYVAEIGNHRILVWNSLPASNGAPADFAIGQPNIESSGGGNGPASLGAPSGMFSDGKKLFVSDTGNDRILVWNSIPAKSGVPADAVLGHPDFQPKPNAATTPDTLRRPNVGIWYRDGRLYVADTLNNRVVAFDF